jgi:hypothetical protein
VAEVVTAWVDKGPESEVDDEGNPKLDEEGQPVIDLNVTHVEEPEYKAPWVRRGIREQVARLRFLYGLRVARDLKQSGDVVVRLVIAEDGSVEESELIEVTFPDDDLVSLIGATVDALEPPERELDKGRKDKKDYRVEVKVTISMTPYAQ